MILLSGRTAGGSGEGAGLMGMGTGSAVSGPMPLTAAEKGAFLWRPTHPCYPCHLCPSTREQAQQQAPQEPRRPPLLLLRLPPIAAPQAERIACAPPRGWLRCWLATHALQCQAARGDPNNKVAKRCHPRTWSWRKARRARGTWPRWWSKHSSLSFDQTKRISWSTTTKRRMLLHLVRRAAPPRGRLSPLHQPLPPAGALSSLALS